MKSRNKLNFPQHIYPHIESHVLLRHILHTSLSTVDVSIALHKKEIFPLRISSVNVTKSAENCNTAYFNTALKASDQKEPELFFPSNWKIKLSY